MLCCFELLGSAVAIELLTPRHAPQPNPQPNPQPITQPNSQPTTQPQEVFYYQLMEVSDFRNDVILAEACRGDVDKYCKDVEPGALAGMRV